MTRRQSRSPWKMVRTGRDQYFIDYGDRIFTEYVPLTKQQAIAFIRFARENG